MIDSEKNKSRYAPFDPSITDFKPIINKIKLQDRPRSLPWSATRMII